MNRALTSFVAASGIACLCVSACDSPTAVISVDAGTDGGAVLGIDVSPLALTPSFSPTIHDYYVRCAAGSNAITLTVTDGSGPEISDLVVVEDQAIVVQDQYWIRCLPHDFPTITVTTRAEGNPTPGYYLINSACVPTCTATYAAVFDTNGTPVWYGRGTSVVNVDSFATDTISYAPNATSPYGWSTDTVIATHALDTLTTTTVSAVGTPTDAHEHRLLPNGDHLLLSYPIEADVDLTGLSTFGADENMADCKIEEVDPQGNLVWSWLASDHVDPVQESIEPGTNTVDLMTVVDPFHCNSIDVDATGNLLVSMRHTNALFYVDRATGTIQWKVGGTPFNKDGADYMTVTADPQGAFNMQHDARFLPNGDVTVFDDHGAPSGTGVARGVEYALDHTAETATFVWQSTGSGQSQYEGSFRRYADGHSVIGWGYVPGDPRVATEVDANGNAVLDIALTNGPSYRAVKVPLSQLDIGVLRNTTAK